MNALIEIGRSMPIVGGRGAGKPIKVKLVGVGITGKYHHSAGDGEGLETGPEEKFTVRY